MEVSLHIVVFFRVWMNGWVSGEFLGGKLLCLWCCDC